MYKIIKNVFFLLLINCSFIQLDADTHLIEQLPYSLEHSWRACVHEMLPSLAASNECIDAKLPEKIQDHFPNFFGYFTYRTEFSVSEESIPQALGIFISNIRDSDEVYINDVLIGNTGEFRERFQKATLYERYYYIPNQLIDYSGVNTLEFRIYNHARYGGLVQTAPLIDSAANITALMIEKEGRLSFYLGLLLLIGGVKIFYFVAQPRRKELLYFSILCFAQVIYLGTYSVRLLDTGIDLNFIFRLNVFFYPILSILFALFLLQFFNFPRTKFVKLLLALTAFCAVATWLVPLDHIYATVEFMEVLSVIFYMPYFLYLLHKAVYTRLPYARVIAGTISLYMGSVLIDILIDQQIIQPFDSGIAGLISPLSLAILFIALTLILIHKHWLYYRIATYDYLTGALTRPAFMERLGFEIARCKRSGETLLFAILDIDDFKSINDEYNHVTGDKVLKQLVENIQKELRENDLFGRYGGDEFCLAANVKHPDEANDFLGRLQKKIHACKYKYLNDRDHPVTITVGAQVIPADQNIDVEALVTLADKYLIAGKTKAKSKIYL